MKSLVYAHKHETIDGLAENIWFVIACVRPKLLKKVDETWTYRLEFIRANRGSHLPEVIFKTQWQIFIFLIKQNFGYNIILYTPYIVIDAFLIKKKLKQIIFLESKNFPKFYCNLKIIIFYKNVFSKKIKVTLCTICFLNNNILVLYYWYFILVLKFIFEKKKK